MTGLAEDLALLLHDPATGRALVDGTSLDRGLGGALLLDLTFADRIESTGDGARAKLVVCDPSPIGDPLLDGALAKLLGPPVRAQRVVERLARRVREPVLDSLAARAILAKESGRFLGLIPTTTWRTVDPEPRRAVQAAVGAALLSPVGSPQPDRRVAGLISLLHAVKAEHKIVDGPRHQLRERAQEIADGDLTGTAVRKAIQAVQASIMAAVAASAVASSGSS